METVEKTTEAITEPLAPGRAFTTREMIDLERDTIRMMRESQDRHPALSVVTSRDLEHDHPHLSEGQRAAVEQILASRDRILALNGVAGAGKRPPSRPSVSTRSAPVTGSRASRRGI